MRHVRHGHGFWIVAFAFVTVMAFATVPGPLWGLYQERDGFSSLTITVVFAMYAIGVLASLLVVGHVSDWYGRRRVLVPALLVNVVSALVFLAFRDVWGLIVARVLNGIGVGALIATSTAWLDELHARERPGATGRRPQVVATIANLGGLGLGALLSGALAQWVGHPLTVPYVVCLVAMAVAVGLVLLTPETRTRPVPLPRYRAQRVTVPAADRGRFFAAGTSAAMAFAAMGLFGSLAPTFLAGTLGHDSRALAGFAQFVVFVGAVAAQTAPVHRPRAGLAAGTGLLVAGMVLVVIAVWLPSPSLALFLAAGAVSGLGSGLVFKGAVGTVAALATDDHRAEAMAALFVAVYVGLSVPVIGLGVLTQYLPPREGLLVFGTLLVAGTLAAAPALLRTPSASVPRTDRGSRRRSRSRRSSAP
jgi:Na+/melibiose symporter-like transporter